MISLQIPLRGVHILEGLNFFDASVMGFVQAHFHNPVTDAIFPVITYFGEAGVGWILLSLLLLFTKKYRRCGVLMLGAMLGAFLAGEVVLKNLVCRPRPFVDYPDYVTLLIHPPGSYSFPSGHSSSSFAAAAVLFHFNRKGGTAALVGAALVAFSRIFLFVHYPTDVLAGILFGLFFALLTLWINRKFSEPKREPLP